MIAFVALLFCALHFHASANILILMCSFVSQVSLLLRSVLPYHCFQSACPYSYTHRYSHRSVCPFRTHKYPPSFLLHHNLHSSFLLACSAFSLLLVCNFFSSFIVISLLLIRLHSINSISITLYYIFSSLRFSFVSLTLSFFSTC